MLVGQQGGGRLSRTKLRARDRCAELWQDLSRDSSLGRDRNRSGYQGSENSHQPEYDRNANGLPGRWNTPRRRWQDKRTNRTIAQGVFRGPISGIDVAQDGL